MEAWAIDLQTPTRIVSPFLSGFEAQTPFGPRLGCQNALHSLQSPGAGGAPGQPPGAPQSAGRRGEHETKTSPMWLPGCQWSGWRLIAANRHWLPWNQCLYDSEQGGELEDSLVKILDLIVWRGNGGVQCWPPFQAQRVILVSCLYNSSVQPVFRQSPKSRSLTQDGCQTMRMKGKVLQNSPLKAEIRVNVELPRFQHRLPTALQRVVDICQQFCLQLSLQAA